MPSALSLSLSLSQRKRVASPVAEASLTFSGEFREAMRFAGAMWVCAKMGEGSLPQREKTRSDVPKFPYQADPEVVQDPSPNSVGLGPSLWVSSTCRRPTDFISPEADSRYYVNLFDHVGRTQIQWAVGAAQMSAMVVGHVLLVCLLISCCVLCVSVLRCIVASCCIIRVVGWKRDGARFCLAQPYHMMFFAEGLLVYVV